MEQALRRWQRYQVNEEDEEVATERFQASLITLHR